MENEKSFGGGWEGFREKVEAEKERRSGEVKAEIDGKKVRAKIGERAVVMQEDSEEPEKEVWPLQKMFEEGKFEGKSDEKERGSVESERGSVGKEHGSVELKSKKFRPVGEMSKEEATKEYLDILGELSQGFTSAEARASGAANYDENGELVAHGRGYDRTEDRIVEQLEGRDGEHFKREWTLGLADDIIRAESDWRKIKDKTTVEAEKLAEDQAELKLERARKEAEDKLREFESGAFAGIRKVLRARKHVELQNKVIELRRQTPEQTISAQKAASVNRRMAKALEAAYSEDYGYGHHKLSYEHSEDKGYQERVNEEYNRKFFSPENEERIGRAIELRRALEKFEPKISTEWKDRYWMEMNKKG